MNSALVFNNISYSDTFTNQSFSVDAGSHVLLATSCETENSIITKLITGQSRPHNGEVAVLGTRIHDIPTSKLLSYRKQIGVVPNKGGLISNLKFWENITLPILYHTGKISAFQDELATKCLELLNFTGQSMALPAHLSLYERRVAALVRCILCNPSLMLYCNIFDGLTQVEQFCMVSAITKFHTESKDCTAIYLGHSNEQVSHLKLDKVIQLQ